MNIIKTFIIILVLTVSLYAIQLDLTLEEKEFVKSHPTIKISSEYNWAPYDYTYKGKEKGYSVDFIKILAQKIGIKLEFVQDTWINLIQRFQNKEIDLINNFSKTKEREKFTLFTKPFIQTKDSVITQQSNNDIKSITDLFGKTVAMGKGWSSTQYIKRNFPTINVLEFNDIDQILEAVAYGKVDAAIDDYLVMNYYINKKLLNNLQVASNIENTHIDFHIGVRDDLPILHTLLQKAYDSISEKELSQLNNKWFPIHINTEFDYSLFWKVIIVFIIYRNRQLVIYHKDIENKNIELEVKNKELQKAEDTIKETLKGFRTMINATLEGIFIFQNATCIDVNDIGVKLLGYNNKEEMLGKTTFDFISPISRKSFISKIRIIETNPYEIKILKKNGETLDALIKNKNIVLNGKKIRVSAVIDLSELKAKENIILEQAKMAALGEMIGNIAHQWRQPLTIISTGATGIQVKKEFGFLTDEFLEETCNRINVNAQYLSKTIDDFRDFIKGDRKKELFSLKENINSFINLVEGSIKNHNINLILDLDKDINIDGYPNELIQCFINIFNNSKDALKSIEEDDRFVFIKTYKEDGRIYIEIKDSAKGIHQDILPKIFEPYFTTKHKSQGTGLGLHMTYNIINDGMKGNILVDNKRYKYNKKTYTGAQFTISLPIPQSD